MRPQSKRPQIPLPRSQDPLFLMKRTTVRLRLSKKAMRDYSSPASWRRLWEATATSQIKMARTMQAQEKQERRCFICQSPNHLMRDHYQGKNRKGPLQPKGPPQNKLACEMAKASPPGRATSQGATPK